MGHDIGCLVFFLVVSLCFALLVATGEGAIATRGERIAGVLFCLAISVIVCLSLVHVLRNNPASRRRQRAMAQCAAGLGMGFEERADAFLDSVQSTALWSKFISCEARSVMHTATPEMEISVFDYIAECQDTDSSPETGSGIRFAGEGIQLPQFTLASVGRPGRWSISGKTRLPRWKIMALRGFSLLSRETLIQIEEDPEFCDCHLLVGPDEESIRAIFSPAVRSLMLDLLRQGHRFALGSRPGQLTLAFPKLLRADQIAERLWVSSLVLETLMQSWQNGRSEGLGGQSSSVAKPPGP